MSENRASIDSMIEAFPNELEQEIYRKWLLMHSMRSILIRLGLDLQTVY